ncbi:MAG: sigma-70 family RNA polymerase sigma factor [Burkholderiales bacterium]|nr:sigma-70 family RNA polymerase sigma factor [Burkholderiales bacterium]
MRFAEPSPPTRQVTELLLAWRQGDNSAFSRLLHSVHDELRRMALSRLRGGETPSLAAGDLLNEALLKLMHATPDWKDRAHFFGAVSMAMRSVLVDHARARQADKRGGGWHRATYTLSSLGEEEMVADLLTLDALLQQLQALDPRAAEVLQLTYFAGLERAEIATVLDVSVATVDRELRFARAWLAERLDCQDLER